jgi:sugar phosphate isomerase/epimerase
MRIGICAPVESSADVWAAGAEFVEEHVQNLLQGQVPDDQWTGKARAGRSALPVYAANSLLPPTLKIVGPSVDWDKVKSYTATVMERARLVGMKVLVFGSAGARNVPAGFDPKEAHRQILDFLKMAVPLADANGIILVAEPLSRDESNIIHTITEAMDLVRQIDHCSFQCLLDTFHFWNNGDSLESVRESVKSIHHVHAADVDGRVPSGESGKSDYRPLFRILKQGGFDGAISVESPGWTRYAEVAQRAIEFLKQQWKEA